MSFATAIVDHVNMYSLNNLLSSQVSVLSFHPFTVVVP